MSDTIKILAKIAALRVVDEGASGVFKVSVTGPSTDISTSFNGDGEVEMNELAFDAGTGDVLEIQVKVGDTVIHTVQLSVENIRHETNWVIYQIEGFEVRTQFLISTPLPKDFIDTAFDVLVGPKAWYFKAEDLYALLKDAAKHLNLPAVGGVSSADLVERVSRLVDMASDAIYKRIAPLSSQEEIRVFQLVDELLSTKCAALDSVVDSSRTRLVESLRNFRVTLANSIKQNKDYIEVTVQGAKDKTKEAVNDISELVDSYATSAKAQTETLKGQVADRVEGVRGQVDSVKGRVSTRISALSVESRQWATDFLNARVVQGKEVLDRAQPYAVRAAAASQPFVSQVATATEPYVTMARPYVEPILSEAKRIAEENKYVGPYVAPVINSAAQALDGAKAYLGVGATPALALETAPANVETAH